MGGHKDRVDKAMFGGKDKIVTASINGSVRVWDIMLQLDIEHKLRNTLTFEQALVLNCIYEIIIFRRLIKKFGHSSRLSQSSYMKAQARACGRKRIRFPLSLARREAIKFKLDRYSVRIQAAYNMLPEHVKKVLGCYVRLPKPKRDEQIKQSVSPLPVQLTDNMGGEPKKTKRTHGDDNAEEPEKKKRRK